MAGRGKEFREIRHRHRDRGEVLRDCGQEAESGGTAILSKYRAIPTVIDGIRFASKKEANRYQELKLLERANKIRFLTLQPKFPITAGPEGEVVGRYVADFSYFEGDNKIVEDVKGVKTPVYRLKKKLVEAIYNIEIREV